MSKAFVMSGIVKKYPSFQLGPFDLDLEPGVVLGFIGPNGAGKSTTMQCLMGLTKVDEGEILIFDNPNSLFKAEWKQDVGYVGDNQVFLEKWSCKRNLKYISKFYKNWSNELMNDLVKRFELPLEKKAKDLSTGNRIKLALIAALSHNPKLLILDEPTSGLDPLNKAELTDILLEVMQSEERAVFYSTHNLSEIEKIADELMFINDGKLLLRSDKDALTEKWRRITFSLTDKDLQDLPGQVSMRKVANSYEVISRDTVATEESIAAFGGQEIVVNRIDVEEIALEILKESRNVANNHQ